MRNFITGLFLGLVLSAGLITSAEKEGPKLSGESGTLNYAIVVDWEIACVDPWVSVPERTIECDSDAPDGPGDKLRPSDRIAKLD